MKYLLENYRGFEFTPLVYLEGAAETKSETADQGVETWELPDFKYTPGESANNAWEPVHKIYNPGDKTADQKKSPYYKMIEKYVNEVLPETNKKERANWLSDSMSSFRPIYFDAKKEFVETKINLDTEFKKQLRKIKNKTVTNLNKLRHILNKKELAIKAEEEISGEDTEKEESKSLNQTESPAIRQKFTDYLEAQNNYYLNEQVQSARLTKLNPVDRNKAMRRYKRNAKKFREAMERRTMARLDYHLNQKETTHEAISQFQKLIELEYKHFANLSGNKSFIDIGDFNTMEYYSDANFNLLSSVQKSSARQDNLYLESMYLMKYEAWKIQTETTRKMMESDCYSSGTEALFITKVNEYRKKTGDKPVSTFEEAKLHFKILVDSRTKIGVTSMYEFFTDFRNVIYGKRLKNMKKVRPQSLQLMVFREREFLLSQRLIPLTEHDRIIVEFMSTGRKGRESILKHKRAVLFKAIKNIKHHYPKYIKKNFSGISKKAGELSYQPNLTKRPTRDDRAARMHALVTLSNEAEGIIQNFSTTETYKGQDLEKQLKNVQHDKNAPVVGLQFKDAKRSRTSPYINALSRGGFNGRDLGIKALKILGVITFMANVANSVKTAQGKDIFEKAANAVGSIATNPGVYIGAAVAGGTHMIEMHPRYLEYPFASAHERMDINAGVKLGRIKKHVGANAMSTFIQRGNPIDNNSPLSKEWLVMDKISDRKIKKLVDKAKKKPHPRLGPVIANKDIEKSIPKNQRHVVLAGLSRSSMNARARFLFYEKFLYGKKPNIQQLRNVCTD